MAIQIVTASRPDPVDDRIREYKGVFLNDATALVSSTVASGGALGARSVTVASATGFASGSPISIAGGGNAGGTIPLETFQSSSPSSNVLSFREKVLQTGGLTVGAAVQQMLKFSTPLTPRSVRLHNLTDGLSWEWIDGMAARSVIRRVWSTGVVTLETSGGPIVVSDGIWLPQSMLGVSKTIAFDVQA